MNPATRNPIVKPLVLLLVWVLLLLGTLDASAGSPTLKDLLPVAGQRGQRVEVAFYGERLHDVTGVLLHTAGITAESVAFVKEKKDDKGNPTRGEHVSATFIIAPDAPLGEHQLRLVTATGVTEMLTFHVVNRPLVEEDENKPSTRENPQPVTLGTTILGRTRSEDVDYFGVELTKGQRLTVQVDAMRLGRGFTDSYLAVLDESGKEIVVSDDTAMLRQDPYLSLIAPKAGRYTILIRDSGYGGSDANRYMMHVGSFTRPAITYPLGGRPGERATIKFIGDPAGDYMQQVQLPNQPDNALLVVPEREGQPAPTGHRLRVNHLTNILEGDSLANDDMKQIADAPSYEVPVAFNGIIERPGDADYFKLRLRKGQAITVNCYASSMGSPLDSVVNLFSAADRKHLLGNDDQTGSDSVLTYTSPEDGEYFLRIRDHLSEGGATYVYRMEVTVAQPLLTTAISVYDRNLPQSRQAIVVPRGNRTAALVRVSRSEVPGDLTPMIDGLPDGVSFKGLGPAQRGDIMPVVFEAGADAPLIAKLVDLGAQSQPQGDSDQRIIGQFSQPTPLVMGDPNRTEYYHSTIDTIPVSVAEAVPFRIDVVEPKAPLVNDGKLRLQVNVTREEGYDGLIRLYPLYLPNGMGATARVDLQKDQTQAIFEFDANAGVPTRDWPLVIYGFGSVKGGPVWVSSQLFSVNVEKPFVAGAIEKASCIQGEEVDITVTLQHPRDWQGEGELKLLGLPAACSAEPVKIKPGQATATFRVSVADNTPVGQNKTLMCELTINIHGEPVIHRFGTGGQLRIDRPKREREAQASKKDAE